GYDTKRQLTLEDSTRDGGYDFGNVFDSAGNATTFRDATQTFNANNQLTGPGTYVYDGNGNPTTFGGTTLTWDVENRMTAHGTALEAAYRGDGLRAWKEGATRTYFVYDGINVVCELDAVGDLLAASTFGAAGLLSRGDVQYQFDPLGDAVHLLDATGDVTANRLFDAWGNELTNGDFNPRGYRAKYGYYTDEETGLVALAYRYYEPGVGRFLNRDPIGYEGGVNVYGYAGNTCVHGRDSLGLLLWLPDQTWGPLPSTLDDCFAFGYSARFPAKEFAEQLARRFGMPTAGLGDIFDSIRHCTWMCLITRRHGRTCAELVGGFHELDNLCMVSQTPWDIRLEHGNMDFHNNAIGRLVGEHYVGSCQEGCLAAGRLGHFRVLGSGMATRQ
ncbi:MAG: RHS repeat-associated core domain-containing protein, partial [Fimbriimonadaceae bacterium]|nr:RHS repeat-associated core domain-containing protein [Fimbriimonadaceae bacterium]